MIIPQERFDPTEKESNTILNSIKYLRKVSSKIHKISLEQERDLLSNMKTLIPFLPIFSKTTCLENEFHRISINENVRDDKKNSRLYSISELKYPPKGKSEKLDYNRASLKKQSVFYAGFESSLNTAVENRPKTGQLITESVWKQKPNTLLRFIPLFQNIRLVNYYPHRYQENWNEFNNFLKPLKPYQVFLIKEIYSFITEEFFKPITNKIEYLFSAYFANAFYEAGVEAIIYPSVPNKYFSENIAIVPTALESKFDFIEARESIVENDPEDSEGIFQNFIEIVQRTKGVNIGDPKTSRAWKLQATAIANEYDQTSGKLLWVRNMTDDRLSELQSKFSFDITE